MGIMEKVIYIIVQTFAFCSYLTTFCISINSAKKRIIPTYMKRFYIYPLIGSLVSFIILLNAYKIVSFRITHTINDLSVSFHYTFLGRFIYFACNKNKFVKLLASIFFLITSLVIGYDFINSTYLAISVSNACLFILCLFYFYTLFTSPPKSQLSREPSFWVCSGVFFGSGVIIPSAAFQKYFIFNFPQLNYWLAIIPSLGFVVMYFFFIKASLCSPIHRK